MKLYKYQHKDVMKKMILSCVFYLSIFIKIFADEGMWLPLLLDSVHYTRMRELGCRLSPEDIYSINNSSLKDAVVLFDRGCTGVMVSEKGLLLTNHHCGYKSIQSHSTPEKNFLNDGFWARSFAEELPNPALKVTFLIRMEDVTERITGNISSSLQEAYRNYYINLNVNAVVASETKRTGHTIVIKPFFQDNQYFLFEYEVFADVRLVAAPPSEIGKFGGDTDNWEWPRHTGDFSIFRVYAGKDNKPAPYSRENVPYKPKKVVPISMKGVEKDDFTMVYGYPANTELNLLSQGVSFLKDTLYPERIGLRAIRLQAMREEMNKSTIVKLQYAAKYFGISNGYKKWQGTIRGLSRAGAVEIKKKREYELQNFLRGDSFAYKKSASLLSDFGKFYPIYNKYSLISDYYDESVATIEMLSLAGIFYNSYIVKHINDTVDMSAEIKKFSRIAIGFLKNYNKNIDKKIFTGLLKEYIKNVPKEYHPELAKEKLHKHKGNIDKWADEIYSESVFCDSLKLKTALKKLNAAKLNKLIADPAVDLYRSFNFLVATTVKPELYYFSEIMDSLYRNYMVFSNSFKPVNKVYPDANQTLRIAYGKAEGYNPSDAIFYNYYTTSDGILEKENPSIDDYHLSAKVKELYTKRDFGEYGDKDGNLRVCFAASNHTSGGNSGSPVFNRFGELIGLNFDRCWEGTMSDILYDPSLCRNIVVDIRYLLFVVDKYANAGYLIDEMDLKK